MWFIRFDLPLHKLPQKTQVADGGISRGVKPGGNQRGDGLGACTLVMSNKHDSPRRRVRARTPRVSRASQAAWMACTAHPSPPCQQKIDSVKVGVVALHIPRSHASVHICPTHPDDSQTACTTACAQANQTWISTCMHAVFWGPQPPSPCPPDTI